MFIVYTFSEVELSPLKINNAKYEFQQTNRLWQYTEFHPVLLRILRDNGHRNIWFLIQLWPNMKIKIIQSDTKL